MAAIQLVTDSTFGNEVLNSSVPTIVLFPSQDGQSEVTDSLTRDIRSYFEQVAQENPETLKIVESVMQASQDTRAGYFVNYLPMAIAFKEGREIRRERGGRLQSYEGLVSFALQGF